MNDNIIAKYINTVIDYLFVTSECEIRWTSKKEKATRFPAFTAEFLKSTLISSSNCGWQSKSNNFILKVEKDSPKDSAKEELVYIRRRVYETTYSKKAEEIHCHYLKFLDKNQFALVNSMEEATPISLARANEICESVQHLQNLGVCIDIVMPSKSTKFLYVGRHGKNSVEFLNLEFGWTANIEEASKFNMREEALKYLEENHPQSSSFVFEQIPIM